MNLCFIWIPQVAKYWTLKTVVNIGQINLERGKSLNLSNNYCLLRTWHLWYSWTKFSSTCLGAKLWTLLSIFPVVYCLIEMGSPKYIWTFPKSSFKIFLAFNKACKKPKRNEISTCLYLFKYIPMYNMKELHPTHIPKVFQYWCSLNAEKNMKF